MAPIAPPDPGASLRTYSPMTKTLARIGAGEAASTERPMDRRVEKDAVALVLGYVGVLVPQIWGNRVKGSEPA